MAGKGGNSKKKRKVFYEYPVGSLKGKARCECHYSLPCPRAAVVKK